MSIVQSVLEIVEDEGRRHGMEHVTVIRLQVGELAAVVPESLNFCFELMREGTIASEAVLEVETVPVVARCSKCGDVFEVKDQVFLCTRCEEPVIELVSGRELNVVSIEGEVGERDGGD